MLAAVLSDIHSNVFALKAVLAEIDQIEVNEIWVAGDTFGYYPWAPESFEAVQHRSDMSILGNHDSWIIGLQTPPDNIAGTIANHNAQALARKAPAALDWLASLPTTTVLKRKGWMITIAHGTPDDPLEGRYYPDDERTPAWLPRDGEILVLGQTHYPLLRGDAEHGLMLNPGSVGQPRDGDPRPSWALLDLARGTAELRRTQYDYRATIARLHELRWHEGVARTLARSGRRQPGHSGTPARADDPLRR